MTRRPTPRPDSCSVQWDEGDLPAYGTAAMARFWVALEQDGPWGHDALVQSHLDPALGRDLADACARAGGRVLLVRRPGAHREAVATPGETGPGTERTVLVAGGLGRSPWLVRAAVTDPRVLLDLPLGELARATSPDVVAALGGEVVTDPVLLVCTNGKRDTCCSVRGRGVAAAVAERHPGRVWECSHTGGHRFAPTGVLLPGGQTVGRLTDDDAVAALDLAARGRAVVGARHDRGMSHLDPVAQAAQSWVRERTGRDGVLDLPVGEPRADGPGVVVPVAVGDDVWQVRVEREVLGTRRRDSCAKDPVPSSVWRVTRA